MSTYTVGASGADYTSLQSCLASGVVADGDTVQILSGYNVNETVGAGVSWVNNVTVQGDVTDPAAAVITWDNPSATNYVFTLNLNNVSGWTLKGLTLNYTGSGALYSGAFFGGWSGSQITVEDCRVNTTGRYAFVYNSHGSLFKRTEFVGTNSTATNCQALGSQFRADIESCLVRDFGHYQVQLGADSTVVNSTFYNGRDASDCSTGHAIYLNGAAEIRNCVIWNNHTKANRRGIVANYPALVTVSDSIIFGSAAADGGIGDISALATMSDVLLSAAVGTSAVLADAPGGDFYPAAGGLAINAGSATYAPTGGDLNRQPFAASPSIGCLEELVVVTPDTTNPRSKTFDAMRYGWGLLYWLKIEGIPTIVAEKVTGKTVSGYQVDGSLVIDSGSKVGSIVDRKTGLGRAFDLTVQLLDTATTRSMFRKPTKYAALGETLLHDDVTAATVTTSETSWGNDYAGASAFYIGNERVTFTATSGTPITSFDTLSRGSTDWKSYTHNQSSAVSTYVTNAPQWYRGRRAELYATPVDPLGYVNESALDTTSVQLWSGNIESDPRVNRDGLWEFKCRPLERRLAQPSAVDASGVATFALDDDKFVIVKQHATIKFRIITILASTPIDETFQFQPFTAGPTKLRFSEVRARIKTAFDAAIPSAISSSVIALHWVSSKVQQPTGAVSTQWTAELEVRAAAATDQWFVAHCWSSGWSQGPFPQRDYIGTDAADFYQPSLNVSPSTFKLKTTLTGSSETMSVTSLDVTIKDGDPTALPVAGWVRLEADDRIVVLPYKALTIEEQSVQVEVDTDKGPELGFGLGGDFIASGIRGEVDCTFIHSDSGRVQDTMRRHIMSSGRGNNDATFDTLPQGIGMDIDAVDTSSFETNLDGLFGVIGGALLQVDSGASFQKLYSGLLALSQRAVVTRTNADTGKFELAAVRTGVANTADVAGTIGETDVARVGKTQPVRPKPTTEAPNTIELSVRGFDEGHYFSSDIGAVRAMGPSRATYTAHGLNRNGLTVPFYAWSESLFAMARGAQAIEVDVAPWTTFGDIGDVVMLTTTHYSVWSRDTGAPSYSGPARVLGVQFDLKRQIYTLTLLIDGARGGGMSLSPSAPVVAFDSASTPTTVDIPHSYLNLMSKYIEGAASFDLLCYLPGKDAADVSLTVSSVVDFDTYVQLSISAIAGAGAATLSLTTAHRLTLPITASSNDAQLRHMHTDSNAEWL